MKDSEGLLILGLIIGEWVKKVWYLYTMKFYSAIKMNAI
jgi:hypothetical protein